MSLVALNPEQQRAVEHRGAPLAVVAGAGTGKTQVITHRAASLVADEVDPADILVITFTNKAAKELRHRLCEMRVRGVYGPRQDMWIGTFHGTGRRILGLLDPDGQPYSAAFGRTGDFQIYNDSDQITLLKALLNGIVPGRELEKVADKVRNCISKLKRTGERFETINQLKLPISADDRPVIREAFLEYKILTRYEERLLLSNAMDWDDLLIYTVKTLLNDNGKQLLGRFEHVLVDEYQDTDALQRDMVDMLGVHLCVVGDDDQAIYGWRGADPGGMRNFALRSAVEVISLEENYRSTEPILEAANHLIAVNPNRLPKHLWTEKEGVPVRVTQLEDTYQEAACVVGRLTEEFGDHAVLYRNNSQSRVFENIFRREGIPYVLIRGTRFYDREVIKDIFAYFHLVVNPHSDSLLRVANRPKRRIGNKVMKEAQNYAFDEGVSLLNAFTVLGDRGNKHAHSLVELLLKLHQLNSEEIGLVKVYEQVLELTNYWRALEATEEAKDKAEKSRDDAGVGLELLVDLQDELVAFVGDQSEVTLAAYLEHVALVLNADTENGSGAVVLSTIHSAKGLEFSHVHLVGFEEGVLPSSRGDEEEERRLAYVAMTRAKDRLDITMSKYKERRGELELVLVDPSRFLSAIPLGSCHLSAF